MSDAQLPPDAGDGESDLPRRPGLRLTEAGVIAAARFEAFADGALKDVRASASDANANGTVMHDAPDAPETAAQREADETSADDQPMLDLGFPDLPHQAAPPPLPGGAPASASQSSERSAIALAPDASGSADSGLEAPALLDPAGAGEHPVETAEAPAAETPMEISPIFSALDAAERAAEAAQQGNATLEADAFDLGILLPQSRPADAEVADTAQDLPQEPEPPADDSAEGDGKGDLEAAGDAADAPDTAPPHPAAPASTDTDDDEAPPANPVHDAAARIAAEASATAAALENLKRLLDHKLPPEIAVAQQEEASGPERAAPPPIPAPAYRPPAHLPITPPPMVATAMAATALSFPADDEPVRSGMAVGSFLAGFALSWVFGAVLYVFLI